MVKRNAQTVLLILTLLLSLSTIACNAPRSPRKISREPLRVETHPVLTVLHAQEVAWNEGDIERFVAHYWKSDDLTFSSAGKTTWGWDSTLANYRRRYPTPEQMGQVRFHHLEVFALGPGTALVLGQWTLDREADPIGGNFSLVFQKIQGQWRIVHDHTSRTPEADKRPDP